MFLKRLLKDFIKLCKQDVPWVPVTGGSFVFQITLRQSHLQQMMTVTEKQKLSIEG